MATLNGPDAIMKALEDIARKMGGGSVSVGWAGGDKYPDGTLIAGVAASNEFGDPSNHQPPRPFFRRMIVKESPTWVGKMAGIAKFTNYDGAEVLGQMGDDIKGALQESINTFTTPPLAASTIAAKGSSKPLVETGDMLSTIKINVEK